MRANRLALTPRKRSFAWGSLALVAALVAGAACWDAPPWSESVEVRVPPGASLSVVADSLAARGILKNPRLFTLWGRIRRLDREIQAGMYAFRPGSGWNTILRDLSRGAVLTLPVTIPEGFKLREIAERIAPITELEADSVAAILTAPGVPEQFGVPGPTLEGYVFPDTYLFAPGTPVNRVIATLTGRYREFWTPERLARTDSLGRSQAEITTLASIIEAEAQRAAEMPLISAVYHNRLAKGYPLQADPTVLYAIGEHRTRLLFRDIDAVADHPYNTYTQPGLPPGPIGSPGQEALSAALYPAVVDYLYFVARGDGSHVFSRTLEEHNRARVAVQRDTVSL